MTSSSYVTIGIVFAVAAVLFVIGGWLVAGARDRYPRSWEPAGGAPDAHAREPSMAWTQAFAAPDDRPGRDERLEMIERLAMLGAPWCADALRAARKEETDPQVLVAIDAALKTLA